MKSYGKETTPSNTFNRPMQIGIKIVQIVIEILATYPGHFFTFLLSIKSILFCILDTRETGLNHSVEGNHEKMEKTGNHQHCSKKLGIANAFSNLPNLWAAWILVDTSTGVM